MTKKFKQNYIMTFQGKKIASFWIKETKDGYTYGPKINDTDIHSTVFRKNSKIRSHIKHTGIQHPPDQYPIGKQISEKHFLKLISKELQKRVKTYHGNSKCWIFSESTWNEVKQYLPRINEKGDYIIPIELASLEVDTDFNNDDIWGKVKIRELIKEEQFFGLKEYPEGLRIIIPTSLNVLFSFPISKIDKPLETMYENLGFNDFF